MSGERPSPLWPDGISKVRPVENHRIKALPEGVLTPVAKEPSRAEQKDRQRLSKPPPADSPVQAQSESKPGSEAASKGQGENKQKYDIPVHPSESDPNWNSYTKKEKERLDEKWFRAMLQSSVPYTEKERHRVLWQQGYGREDPNE